MVSLRSKRSATLGWTLLVPMTNMPPPACSGGSGWMVSARIMELLARLSSGNRGITIKKY